MPLRTKHAITAYRIADLRHPIFDGTGAARFGGRWNSPGYAVIYAGLSYASCLLEKLAQTGIGSIPKNQGWIEFHIPREVSIEEVKAEEIPGWDLMDLIASREYGDRWIKEKRSAVLIVPSVIAFPHERNIVINPANMDFAKIGHSEPQPIVWDERLFKK